MKHRIAWALVAAAAACVTSPSLAGRQPQPAPADDRPTGRGVVDLRPKFVPGRETRYQFELTSANTLKSDLLPELDGDQTLTQTIDLRMRIAEVREDGATVELIYDKVRATFESPDIKAAFDSSQPSTVKAPVGTQGQPSGRPAPRNKSGTKGPQATDPEMDELLAQIMRPMVGTRLTMQVDRDGNIRSVSGGEALGGGSLGSLGDLGKLAGGAGGGLGGLGGGLGGLGASGGGGGGGGGPMAWLISGPGQRSTVRVGETWTNSDTLSGTPMGGFSMKTRHTCDSFDGSTASLSFSGQAGTSTGDEPSGGAPNLMGFQLKESSYRGNYRWDVRAGELRELNSTLTTRIEQPTGEKSATSLAGNTRIRVRRLN